MTKQLQTHLDYYREQMRLMHALGSAEALLSWDRETYMPVAASPDRGEMMSALGGFIHELFTDKKFVKAVETLHEQRSHLSTEWRRSVVTTHRGLQKSVKLSKKFVEETNHLVNASQAAWLKAKEKDDFPIFQPFLEKIVENRKQYAAFIDPNKDPYDILLDDYEEGLTTAFLEPVFARMRDGLKELLPKIMAQQQKWKNPLNDITLDHTQMRTFLEEMISQIGFTMDRGVLADVEHPFETKISMNDIRVNTRFDKKENSFTIMGLVHEVGHGLYEQNVNPDLAQYFLAHGVSLGIHESQSRFLENVIGRSEAFWKFFLPKLKKHFDQLKSVSLDEVVGALNMVQPSLIRTEADEVTYNLHIILRFEIEKDLMAGKIHVKDLPEIWRSKMEDLVGIEPKTNREGVLQDVHWAWANLGYFPTYSLGNLNAAQLFRSFAQEYPDWEKEIAEGNFTHYIQWFKSHVWWYGELHTPEHIMKDATGEKTNEIYLLEYLQKKYLK